MTRNVGSIDRVLRIAAGIALLAFAVAWPGPEHWFGLIGLVPLATGVLRWCPAYSIVGIKSR